MTREDFREFVRNAAMRAVAEPNRISRLVLTQTDKKGEPKIREPEMRHALAQEAEARQTVHYGIEVPTRAGYRFTLAPGDKETSARHDFVIMAADWHGAPRANLVELKKDSPARAKSSPQLDYPTVRKDFQKLMLETATHGKSMLHILHASNKNSVPGVLAKYNVALREALTRSVAAAADHTLPSPLADPSWLSLFLLVVRRRGKPHGDRPILHYQDLAPFGAALQEVQNGLSVFRENLLAQLDVE